MTRKKKDDIEFAPIENNELKVVNSFNTETCKVLWIKPTTFAISFKGYGITLNSNIDSSIKTIDIEYQGKIGNPDFRILNY